MRVLLSPAVAVLVLGGACSNLSAQTDRAAVITNPGEASRAEIQSILAEALGDRAIRIADDALTETSILTLEGAAPRGRDLGRPERFDLVENAGRCYLIYQGSGERWRLSATECRAL